MTAPPPPLRRGPAERVQAWIVMGPLGHLWSVVVDLSLFVVRRLAARARRWGRVLRRSVS